MNRIPQCDECSIDGKCAYQHFSDCQNCHQNINDSNVKTYLNLGD